MCLGAALLVVTNLRAVEARWAHAGRASVYLKDGATQDDVDALRTALGRVPGVLGVHYVSSVDARAEFGQTQLDGRPALAGLPLEAFPASLEVDVAPDLPDADLADMVAKMRQLPAIDDVETYQSWTERLARLVRGGVAAAGHHARVVFAAVLAVVGSTMRMALHRRRAEVEVLKLVGATDGFVKKPFVVEGGVQGALGAVGAVALLGVLFLLVRGRLDDELAALIGVAPTFLPWGAVLGMVVLGGAPRRRRGAREPPQAGGRVRIPAAFGALLGTALAVASGRAALPAIAAPTDPALALAALDRRIADLDAEELSDKAEIGEARRRGGRPSRPRARARPRLLQADASGPASGRRRLRCARHARDARRAGTSPALRRRRGRHSPPIRAADLARELERVGRDRSALASQRTSMDAARIAMADEQRRQAAFDHAFQTSTGSPADYVAVYGGTGAPPDPQPGGFAAARGRLLMPVAGRAEIHAARRDGTDGPGLELRAPVGTAVRAVFAGRVAFADRFGAYGRIVILDHGDRYYTVSGDLDEVDVKIGQDVSAGERVGTVGDDGQGAMLYFEVRHGSQTVAPGPWLGL